jgi:hypothetical protein
MKCRFLSPALVELGEAAEFYEGRVAGLGADFLDEVDAAIERICRFPEAWGRLGDDYRRCSLRKFPFLIIYMRQKTLRQKTEDEEGFARIMGYEAH